MKRAAVALLLAALAGAAPAAAATLAILIDISDQKMSVVEDGRVVYHWDVSTARPGYLTPLGRFSPTRLEETWFSTVYDNAPMPHSIFFYGGYAIHGTTETARLGQPVSHGCVRLHPENAAALFEMVEWHGMDETEIFVFP
jgi:lipoprotein-anchoring transpeptidase ErfK/SrfK